MINLQVVVVVDDFLWDFGSLRDGPKPDLRKVDF
jgi:hypothetical protein